MRALVSLLMSCAAFSAWSCGHKNPTTFVGGNDGGSRAIARGGAPAVEDPNVTNGGAGMGDTPQGGDGSGDGDAGSPTLSPGNGPYDPNQVYLLGTLEQALAGVNASALVSRPNLYTVGFPGQIAPTQIWKSQLVYVSSSHDGLRIAAPDYVGSLPYEKLDYPADPAKNDPLVPSPPCSGPVKGAGPTAVFSGPGDRLIYRCPDETWYEGGVALPLDEYWPITLGAERLAFVQPPLGGERGVMSFDDGEYHRLDARINFRAVRAHGAGFHVVADGTLDDELWDVDAQGNATLIGHYVEWRAEYVPSGAYALAPNDDVYLTARTHDDDNFGVIVRRTLAGEFEVVYTEADNPIVKLWSSAIFSGP